MKVYAYIYVDKHEAYGYKHICMRECVCAYIIINICLYRHTHTNNSIYAP